MRAMLAGGVTFVTPEEAAKGKKSGRKQTTFRLYESYHDAVLHEKALQPRGLSLQVEAEKPAALKVGSPVLYNNIKIGEVMDLGLDHQSHRIIIDLLIFQKFRYLINGSSRFYGLSGIKAEASLQGISLESGSLESIISGGISLYNPEHITPLKKGRIFHLYKNLNTAEDADGLQLTLHLHSANGVNKNTKIRYQGIVIGRIVALDFNVSFDQVIARAVVRKEAKKLFCKDSVLFLVGPQVGLDGIRNINTILGGAYISLWPGTGKPSDEFSVLPRAPGRSEMHAGLNIILESPDRGSLKPGSPVYYRRVPVGSITGYQLSPTGRQVWLRANILPEYAFIVRQGTKFWNVSGVEVNGGVFSGLSVRSESLEALVKGGVALATPTGKDMGGPVTDGHHFPLAEKGKKEWRAWAPDLRSITNPVAETNAATRKNTPGKKPRRKEKGEETDTML